MTATKPEALVSPGSDPAGTIVPLEMFSHPPMSGVGTLMS